VFDSVITIVYTMYILLIILKMTTKLQKWGNSLGVRLPKAEIKKTGLKEGKNVTVHAFRGGVFIKPTENNKDIVSKINSKNKHKEIDWGSIKGNEVW